MAIFGQIVLLMIYTSMKFGTVLEQVLRKRFRAIGPSQICPLVTFVVKCALLLGVQCLELTRYTYCLNEIYALVQCVYLVKALCNEIYALVPVHIAM